jgi:hypothetical protein
MHSSRGRLRTMCGLRTGGWSLPGVMSDWKRCVDWLLAKYCRCRLRLDWCWCGWRLSVEGHRRCGLQVWRSQVGLVRGTQWPAESSAGRKVARTAGRSRGRFLGWASKPKSSRDYVGAESWVAIGGGYTESAGFVVVHQKTTRLLGWATKPRLKTRRGGAATQAGSTTQEGRSDCLGQSNRSWGAVCLWGAVWPPGSLPPRSFEAEDTRRDRKACVEAKQVAIASHPSDVENLKTSRFAIEGHVSLVIE